MMKRLTVSLALACALLFAGSASAQQMFFYGDVHPVNPMAGGGFCYTNTPHAHPYMPDPNVAYLFRQLNGHYYFSGDPYHFGYRGQAFGYYGHHPLPTLASHCYLDGQHYHHFVPPTDLAGNYVINNGYYYYNGVLAPLYYSYRNSYYRYRHTYWYTPAYSTYYRSYQSSWNTYGHPASINYIYNRPSITYRYDRPPPPRVWTRTSTYVRPAYQYNTQRPNTRDSYYRPRPGAVTRTTTTAVRPSGSAVRTTTTTTRSWRRR